MELNAHIGLRVEEAEGRPNGSGQWQSIFILPMRWASRSVRIYNDCCFTLPFQSLEETVVPHPNQKHTEKKFWNVWFKTSQMVTSQAKNSLPLVNLVLCYSSLNCITGKSVKTAKWCFHLTRFPLDAANRWTAPVKRYVKSTTERISNPLSLGILHFSSHSFILSHRYQSNMEI